MFGGLGEEEGHQASLCWGCSSEVGWEQRKKLAQSLSDRGPHSTVPDQRKRRRGAPMQLWGSPGPPYSSELAVSLTFIALLQLTPEYGGAGRHERKGRGSKPGTHKLLDSQGSFSASHPLLTSPLPSAGRASGSAKCEFGWKKK